MTLVEQEILAEVRKLDTGRQQQVLDYIRSLERPHGEPGWRFLERTRDVHIDSSDLEAMRQAIVENCERDGLSLKTTSGLRPLPNNMP
jgi:hypothetical protein